MRFEKANYENTQEHLDGNEYIECTFQGCTLVYSGGILPILHGCSMNDCSWKFDGAAERTVAFMSALYHGGGKELIDKTLEQIRTGF
jgi:hypothetical protein